MTEPEVSPDVSPEPQQEAPKQAAPIPAEVRIEQLTHQFMVQIESLYQRFMAQNSRPRGDTAVAAPGNDASEAGDGELEAEELEPFGPQAGRVVTLDGLPLRVASIRRIPGRKKHRQLFSLTLTALTPREILPLANVMARRIVEETQRRVDEAQAQVAANAQVGEQRMVAPDGSEQTLDSPSTVETPA